MSEPALLNEAAPHDPYIQAVLAGFEYPHPFEKTFRPKLEELVEEINQYRGLNWTVKSQAEIIEHNNVRRSVQFTLSYGEEGNHTRSYVYSVDLDNSGDVQRVTHHSSMRWGGPCWIFRHHENGEPLPKSRTYVLNHWLEGRYQLEELAGMIKEDLERNANAAFMNGHKPISHRPLEGTPAGGAGPATLHK